MFVVGGFVGAITSGPVSGKHGKVLVMRLGSLFFIIGAALETLAGTVPLMSLGRFISGLGAGISQVIVPLYISAIAPPKERGLFGSVTQVSINLGILLTQTLGFYLSKGTLWRIILGVGAVLGLVQAIGLCFMPDDPTWLAAHQDPQGGQRLLQRIRGAHINIDEETAKWDTNKSNPEAQGLLQPNSPVSARGNSSSSSCDDHDTDDKPHRTAAHIGFFQVIQNPDCRPAIIATVGVMLVQQFTGINSIMMYSVSLLEGVLPISSSALTIMISILNLVTTVACAPLADRIGRKPVLLLSITGMGMMSLLLALSLRWQTKLLSAISVLAFVAFFAAGLGPVPFMLAGEMVGPEAEGATQSWALGSSYAGTYVVAQFFPILNTYLNDWLGGKGWVYFIFAAAAVLSFLFVTWRVPETKGKKDPDEVWGRTRRVD